MQSTPHPALDETPSSKARAPLTLCGLCALCTGLWFGTACGDVTEKSGTPQEAGSIPAATAETSTPGKLSQAPRAEALDLQGLDPESLALIEESVADLEARIEEPAYWTQLGMVYHAHRSFELARTCYEQRLLRDADDARTWYFLALAQNQLGASREVTRSLDQALAIDATYAPSHWRLGLTYLSEGQLEPAEKALEDALRIAPEDSAALVGMARVRLQQDRTEEAIELLKQQLERVPEDENARFLLGTAYRKQGKIDEAARILITSTGADPVQEDRWRDEIYSLRRGYRLEFLSALQVLQDGNTQKAIRQLTELHERQPEDTLVHLSLHRAYRMNGELDRAIALLLDAERIKPQQDMIHLHLAGAYREKAHQSAGGPQKTPDAGFLERARASALRT